MVKQFLTLGVAKRPLPPKREKAVYARRLETPERREIPAPRDMPAADLEIEITEERWSRSARLAFLLAAATLCWAVPILVAYLLVVA